MTSVASVIKRRDFTDRIVFICPPVYNTRCDGTVAQECCKESQWNNLWKLTRPSENA